MKKDENELAQDSGLINQEVRQSSVRLSVNKLRNAQWQQTLKILFCALYTVFIVQVYPTSQYVVPRGGIFPGKWRSSFAGSSDGKISV
jgi:hypothetical protein